MEDQFSTKKAPFGRQPPYKRDLMGRSYLTLRIPNAARTFTLLAIKKKANNQYRQPFYNISEVVPIIKVAKATNNLRDDQLK